jgi:uncharacterized RDD family membrane protein YckC
VECQYCNAENDPEERRCTRCGRRIQMSHARPAPPGHSPSLTFPIQTSTAPALEGISLIKSRPKPPASNPAGDVPPEAPKPTLPEVQPYLFRDESFRDLNGPRVVPIPTLTPLQPPPKPAARRAPRPEAHRPRRNSTPGRRDAGPHPPQHEFEFNEPAPLPLSMQVEVICCDAPVALPGHRILAAAVDLSLIFIAMGFFLLAFWLCSGDIAMNRQTVPALATIAITIAAFYRMLWCIVNTDTPGMRFAGLRLVDFDGRTPGREQRGRRQIASLLSLLSAGLGLVWAMVDEENLTWHDQISKTFPTPG